LKDWCWLVFTKATPSPSLEKLSGLLCLEIFLGSFYYPPETLSKDLLLKDAFSESPKILAE
jgi:hypothetical protein